MSLNTLTQSTRNNPRLKKPPFSRTFKLRQKPQILTMMWRMVIRSPKKPNAGKRRVGKCKLRQVKRHDRVTIRLPGQNYFPRKFGKVLVGGGRANDTPGVGYRGIRGYMDFIGHIDKRKTRSFWGLKREKSTVVYIARWLRKEGILTVKDFMDSNVYGF